MSDEKKKKRYSVLTTSSFSSWRRSSTSGSISQSSRTTSKTTTSSSVTSSNPINAPPPTATSSSSVLPSTSSEPPPPASAPPRISIYHKMVPSKSKFRQCDVCEHIFIFDFVRKQHLDDVYACNVCGIRVHKGCLDRVKNDCKITTQYMGGILENAVIQKNVHKTRKLISMTTSTLDDVTTFNSEINEEMDEETVLMTWEDVTIKLTDVDVMTKIGDGRFGSVYFGGYHGNAAVRFVNMNYLSQEDRRADVFATEIVSAYKNSRHDHIALFYGYVSDPVTNTYAIVTNFYQHNTLYHRIHEQLSEDFDQSWTFQISLQICQAMSYLHKKKILHRDLRTKNILLDNPNRVVVTDFALMKLERLENPRRNCTLLIPNHWIDYLSPEIAGNLMIDWRGDVLFQHELPFSQESDVYSFGTIFFELLLRRMPTGCDSWDQKLYAKMCGQKAALQRLDAQLQKIDGKLHELLLECWSSQPEKRPSFQQIVKRITVQMPRKESNKQKRRSTAHENPLF
ncbi:Kinase suppressor of Ras B [Caenorhabditis elegans]|uniref:Isoform b of Kinase suppressor of Ras B n=1 Tax=Caenorhabditis elegans TaxID=6239 RepID=G5EDA5-2|nr:Kinase suppressor of Ras B [Caenorhabditis elegans]AAL79359.1 KSR-2b [Caenorhabditis elegans]CAB70240.2 Kinase suppressor of Ras B [Caenorhabditis elegans]|eukprot:NP_001021519.1 Kinase suppressor of Ras B [Caenorhabditis elegans]